MGNAGKLAVFGAYATAIEEPWDGVIHAALTKAAEAGAIDYTYTDDIGYAGDMERVLQEVAEKNKPDVIFGDAFGNEEAVRRALNKFEPQEDPGVAVPFEIVSLKSFKLPNGEYRIIFGVQNLTDKMLAVRGIPYDSGGKALMGGKRFKVPPKARVEDMDVVVPMAAPKELRVYCGSFQTNRLLHW